MDFPTVQMLLTAHPWCSSLCSSLLYFLQNGPASQRLSQIHGQSLWRDCKGICFSAGKHVVVGWPKSPFWFFHLRENPKKTFWPTQYLVVLPLEMLAAMLTLSAKVHRYIRTSQNHSILFLPFLYQLLIGIFL